MSELEDDLKGLFENNFVIHGFIASRIELDESVVNRDSLICTFPISIQNIHCGNHSSFDGYICFHRL